MQNGSRPTFTPAPVDGSLTQPEIFDYHATASPNHPLFVYSDSTKTTRTILYSEAWRIMKRSASIIHRHYKRLEDGYIVQESNRAPGQGPTIAILASADSISFFAAIFGIMRLGFVPFPISIRNSPVAVAHLIKNSHALQLLVSPDLPMQHLASDALALLEKEDIFVEVLPMIQFDDVSDESHSDVVPEITLPKLGLDKILCFMHSSGSTAFPKIIPLLNSTIVSWAAGHRSGEVDLCGVVVGSHTAPLFHIMGLDNVFRAAATGAVLAVFRPSSPPLLPTPESYLEAALATKTSLVFCVPSFVETWSKDPVNIPIMAAFKGILYGGAPLNKAIGDQLVRAGVALYPAYGATESGCISMYIPRDKPTVDQWEYFKLAPHLDVEMVPQDGMEDIFEAVIVQTPQFRVNVINSMSSDGRGAYRTNDLLQRHPTYPSLWRIYGRTDDQIMLSNGEKTNPVPLEAILVRDPHIASAVIFGRGRYQNGVLVEPKKELAFDPKDETRLAEYRDLIWPSVEKLNEYAPSHSRLFKEMILVSSPSKPFEYTVKGTPRRSIVIKAYQQEIDSLYEAVKESSQTDIKTPLSWTENETLVFVRTVIERVMKARLTDNADLFQHGCDSLQATSIRNSIMYGLRRTASRVALLSVPNNFVYLNPTILALHKFVLRLLSQAGSQDDDEDNSKERARAMELMLEKYGASFQRHTPRFPPDSSSIDSVVLLTGTTGRFGCHLLAQLISRPSVTKVYALNRSSRGSVKDRQIEAFDRWRLNVDLLDSPKVKLLECDMANSDLGLGDQVFEEIKNSITSIIHNAWRVDFNLSLSSFEPLVSSVRNLVELATGSPRHQPPPITFTSSIGVLMSQAKALTVVPELPITDPSLCVGIGYSESKWVAESVLLRAMQQTGVQVHVVRVGQICGDRACGGWNEQEWVGALTRASQVLGAVPERDEMVSWIPADVGASALIDMLGSSLPVLHLVHPAPVPWSVISDTASRILKVPVITYTEWVSRLQDAYRASASDPDALMRNPALKLVDFFSEMGQSGVLGTDRAVEASNTLRTATSLGPEDVGRWIGYWQSTGFVAA